MSAPKPKADIGAPILRFPRCLLGGETVKLLRQPDEELALRLSKKGKCLTATILGFCQVRILVHVESVKLLAVNARSTIMINSSPLRFGGGPYHKIYGSQPDGRRNASLDADSTEPATDRHVDNRCGRVGALTSIRPDSGDRLAFALTQSSH